MNNKRFELAVVGGGLAGVAAAVSAARLGISTALIQNRPVLGGNSSSEVRVPVGGACDFNPWARESGILEEFFLQERTQDPRRIWLGVTPSLWDITLYDLVRKEKNISLFLNTDAYNVTMHSDSRIASINCRTLGNEQEFELSADIFIDSTGDGTIAAKAGAEYRIGRESKSEFNEQLAPDTADNEVMGSSLLFHTEDAQQPVPFHPPVWIEHFAVDEDLLLRTHDDITAGYWWIEVGNPPFDTITDNEKIRDELYRQLLGVWDHIKNQDDHGADNLHIDFIGAVPGKRESRRIVGDYMMIEADIQRDAGFRDAVAYGGWFCDLHTMGGILNKMELPEPSFNNDLSEVDKRQVYTYSIPLRSLYARKVENLLMAGRNISVSHVALGSTRLMATCAVIGQAAGTSAVWCVKKRKNPREICEEYIGEIQTQLLKDDCYIPGQKNRDPDDIARTAEVAVSSHAKLVFPQGEIGFEFEHPKQKTYTRSNLDTERAQLFPCSTGKVSQLNLQLRSESKSEQTVKVSIYKAQNIVGFDCRELLFTTEINVPAGYQGYFPVTCGIETDSQSLLYVTAVSTKEVFWLYSPNPPTGTVSAARIIQNWKPQKGSYGLQLIPDSYPYRGDNLLSGITRPDEWTNIWISDPEKEGRAWVTYTFLKQQIINVIHLTFDTNVNLAHMSVPGLYKAPECVKDYRIFGLAQDNNWIELVSVSGNFQRKCIHRIKAVSVYALKLEILETNGDSSARLYELRAYHE